MDCLFQGVLKVGLLYRVNTFHFVLSGTHFAYPVCVTKYYCMRNAIKSGNAVDPAFSGLSFDLLGSVWLTFSVRGAILSSLFILIKHIYRHVLMARVVSCWCQS